MLLLLLVVLLLLMLLETPTHFFVHCLSLSLRRRITRRERWTLVCEGISSWRLCATGRALRMTHCAGMIDQRLIGLRWCLRGITRRNMAGLPGLRREPTSDVRMLRMMLRSHRRLRPTHARHGCMYGERILLSSSSPSRVRRVHGRRVEVARPTHRIVLTPRDLALRGLEMRESAGV